MKWELLELPDNSANRVKVRDYLRKKFRSWKPSVFASKRQGWRKKAYPVLLAAENTPYSQIAKDAYTFVFLEGVPAEAEMLRQCPPARDPGKMGVDDWRVAQEQRVEKLRATLATLEKWLSTGKYQEGEDFYGDLVVKIELIDARIMDAVDLSRMSSVAIGRSHKLDVERGENSFSAEFEELIGVKQEASVSFTAGKPDFRWGEIKGKLEQSFRAGAWAEGKVKTEYKKAWTDLGFSAEVQAALAVGIELDVSGELMWSKGDSSITLGGRGNVFAGVRAELEAKLSVDARKGLEMAFKAGVFAGFKATVSGSLGFAVAGRELAKLEAEAGVTFGVAAEVSIEISAPILGPSTFSFSTNVALGLGINTAATISIDFAEMALSAQELVLRIKGLRHLLVGYTLDLQKQEARNLYYLKKTIARCQAEISEIEDSFTELDATPEDEVMLLRSR